MATSDVISVIALSISLLTFVVDRVWKGRAARDAEKAENRRADAVADLQRQLVAAITAMAAQTDKEVVTDDHGSVTETEAVHKEPADPPPVTATLDAEQNIVVQNVGRGPLTIADLQLLGDPSALMLREKFIGRTLVASERLKLPTAFSLGSKWPPTLLVAVETSQGIATREIVLS